MAIRLFIDGAAGTTGLEIRERLQGRSEFDLIVLDDAQRKDETARRDALHAADIAILCLPDEAAKAAVTLAQGSDVRIIDASSAHRVAQGWTYGFPEIVGHAAIADAQFVSNPGCYPTGFLALIAPLVRAGHLPTDFPYSVNAVSGYSGGGNALIDRFEADPTIAFRAYGLALGHKHLTEMQAYAGLTHAPVFSPSVIPAHRGMLVDVPLPLTALPGQPQPGALHAALAEFYGSSAVVTVAPEGEAPAELLLHRSAAPWDGSALHVFGSADGSQARLIARLDNLGKGASGAAIQNLNIMCGLPETTGLRL
ncbi:N-acetyl-gamma-glutamyl-phosphate reductase [Erythrobacter neustonensis]|uniref:N-acetyl-gamma-glutamyl-phosphate reductase n=1 Tax=Erythrobacter neustonensis TaxID=1112 RepID=A0A192D4R7_9SPHN|nr:N-acetyl-gamma-glutamyl-phosphate reductase [Erythrobacter neustonensis]ANK13026.1 N-acetyl-gamma-glutamyl-phosphate reductase [Erythrobacter neustonensis]